MARIEPGSRGRRRPGRGHLCRVPFFRSGYAEFPVELQDEHAYPIVDKGPFLHVPLCLTNAGLV